MVTSSLWYKPFTRQTARLVEIIDQLDKQQISLKALHMNDTPSGAGLLFLDSFSSPSEIQETLDACSIDPTAKLIAVSISPLPTSFVWSLLQGGVTEVISWFEVKNPVQIILSRLNYWHILEENVAYLQTKLVGTSKRWITTLRQIVDMALSDCPVLITGESGTGKELVAQEIHALDNRAGKQDCVVVDCTNLIAGLSGSELFGHEKGAFTNAISNRDGAIALAHQGTLFLDELGELPLPLQAEFLRTLQEGTYKRVGSNTWRKSQFRLISATNRDLSDEVKKGTFRQDLFYRVSGWTCQLPPLRERKEDIPVLAEYFFRKQHRINQPIDRQVLDFLQLRDYPGNVRELQQLVNRIANKHLGEGPITIGDIPQSDWPDFRKMTSTPVNNDLELAINNLMYSGFGLKEIKDAVTEIAKTAAIHQENGNLKMAAQRLGCSERILQMHQKVEPVSSNQQTA